MILPIVRARERVDIGRSDSDTTLFADLMYYGELVMKLTVAGMLAAVGEDRERSNYRQCHDLVRADGLGSWADALDEVVSGATSRHLVDESHREQRELTEKSGVETWQNEAVMLMHSCVRTVDPAFEDLPTKVDGRRWIRYFSRLRNKTRGHGATLTHQLAQLCPSLEQSIAVFTHNFSLFEREWAYLHRNLSGKYRVTPLSATATGFDHLKSSIDHHLEDGVYVCFREPARIALVDSNVDASDFYVANGGFTEKQFEMLSYATGDSIVTDSSLYLQPVGPLPLSETRSIGELDLHGNCFANLPPAPPDYVRRLTLESELRSVLLEERHPVVTLVGRGGIGKTSLALTALNELTGESRFQVIAWFSARDLDLLPQGPKRVTPDVLTIRDISKQYVGLTQPSEAASKGFKQDDYLAQALEGCPIGPSLFVFDNFETITNPAEVYRWLDTYIRPPNKILITTRHREFKGDYAIEVRGMTETECDTLIDATSSRLGVKNLITREYRNELVVESGGHPYVIKILLGDVAKAGRLKPIERILADENEILTAIFERTYTNLSPAAQRVFLTLCNWRSTLPLLAIEGVLLRPENEKMAVRDAVDELERSSFVEVVESEVDGQQFINTPLVASLFGKRKLGTSPIKSLVQSDTEMLHHFGAGKPSDVRHGVRPRVERMIRHVATRIGRGEKLSDYAPMLEFISRDYPPTWLFMAELYEEAGTVQDLEKAKNAVRQYLESLPGDNLRHSWKKLASLARRTSDLNAELHALVEMCELPETSYPEISNTANRFNQLLATERDSFDAEGASALIGRLVTVMEARITEADATDCSRLAWLHIHARNEQLAKPHVQRGLKMDPENEYCQRLAGRMHMTQPNT